VNILAVRLARLGDVVLLLPALGHLKRSLPGSRVTLLTGSPCAPLAELAPALDEVLAVDRLALRDGPRLVALAGLVRLVREIRSRRFDLVIDFHGFRETNLLAWLSGAPHRVGIKRHNESCFSFCFSEPPVPEDKSIHEAAMFQRVVERFGERQSPESKTLAVPKAVRAWLAESVPSRPLAAAYVDAPTPLRIWPPERFAVIADHIASGWDMDVLILSGRDGERLVRRVLEASTMPHRLHGFSQVTLPQLAGLIASSCLLVSNDTGPMHFGPALKVPTIGLFSVGLPEHFRPLGPRDLYLRGDPIERITTRQVIEAIEQLRPTLDPNSRCLSSESGET
jgi:ADP-heptose:LPS heptosyltransferase